MIHPDTRSLVETRFRALNLELSPGKIVLLAYKFDRELTPIKPNPFLQIANKPIRCASPEDGTPLVYLGTTINRPGSYAELRQTGWLSPKRSIDGLIAKGLEPLQQWGLLHGLTFPQKLDYVATYVALKLQYPLRVGTVKVGELEKVVGILKEAVKSWAGVPMRKSDAFLYMPRHRLGLGLSNFRIQYRRAQVDTGAKLLGVLTKASSMPPPLAEYTRNILIPGYRAGTEYLGTGRATEAESPVLGLQMAFQERGKSGERARSVQSGEDATAHVTRVGNDNITQEYFEKHRPAAPIIAGAGEGHVAIANLLHPTTMRDCWRWGKGSMRDKYVTERNQILRIAPEVARGELLWSKDPECDDDQVDRLFQWAGSQAPKMAIRNDGKQVKGWIWLPGTGKIVLHITHVASMRGKPTTPAKAANGCFGLS
uniref:Uncharacterized protein n=1 Tax=Branchiostoma floridae TaxID=7739 RepID=C3Y9R3_BRAFL|eukprot:XP_002607309.1 hypothetical protein BRAFLDRAFT_100661 [Branchiostoma floridae]